MVGLFGDGILDEVLFCCGDSFEEGLHWVPKLGFLWIWWSLMMWLMVVRPCLRPKKLLMELSSSQP